MIVRRLVAFYVDITVIVVVAISAEALLGEIPGLRAVPAALLLVKDAAGASPGKWLLGLRVVTSDSGAASLARRIVRNVTLLVFLGNLEEPESALDRITTGLAATLWLVEMFLVLTWHNRVGDWMAGTRVERALKRAEA